VTKKSPTRERNHCFFVWGINSNLRGTDLVKIKFEYLGVYRKGNGIHFPETIYITIKENKTQKLRRVYINNNMMEALKMWVKKRGTHSGYLFCNTRKPENPVSVHYFRYYLNDVGDALGLHIGLRVMRKTWAYHAWKSGIPIEVLAEAMNHSTPAVTKRYLGIDQEEVKEAFMVEI